MTEGDDLETAAALSGRDNSPVRRVVLFLSLTSASLSIHIGTFFINWLPSTVTACGSWLGGLGLLVAGKPATRYEVTLVDEAVPKASTAARCSRVSAAIWSQRPCLRTFAARRRFA